MTLGDFWGQIEDHVRRVAWGRTSAESEALARAELAARTKRWLEQQGADGGDEGRVTG